MKLRLQTQAFRPMLAAAVTVAVSQGVPLMSTLKPCPRVPSSSTAPAIRTALLRFRSNMTAAPWRPQAAQYPALPPSGLQVQKRPPAIRSSSRTFSTASRSDSNVRRGRRGLKKTCRMPSNTPPSGPNRLKLNVTGCSSTSIMVGDGDQDGASDGA